MSYKDHLKEKAKAKEQGSYQQHLQEKNGLAQSAGGNELLQQLARKAVDAIGSSVGSLVQDYRAAAQGTKPLMVPAIQSAAQQIGSAQKALLSPAVSALSRLTAQQDALRATQAEQQAVQRAQLNQRAENLAQSKGLDQILSLKNNARPGSTVTITPLRGTGKTAVNQRPSYSYTPLAGLYDTPESYGEHLLSQARDAAQEYDRFVAANEKGLTKNTQPMLQQAMLDAYMAVKQFQNSHSTMNAEERQQYQWLQEEYDALYNQLLKARQSDYAAAAQKAREVTENKAPEYMARYYQNLPNMADFWTRQEKPYTKLTDKDLAYAARVDDLTDEMRARRYLDENELAIATYLRNTKGEAAAKEYIDSMMELVNARQMEALEGKAKTLGKEAPVVGALAARVENVANPLLGGTYIAGQALKSLGSKAAQSLGFDVKRQPYKLDPNSPYFAAGAARNSLDQGVMESMGEGTISDIGRWLYSNSMGAIDSRLLDVVMGPLGEAYTSLGAMVDTTRDTLQTTGDSTVATLFGAADGLIELLTEHMGIDQLTDTIFGSAENFAINLFKTTLGEGLEGAVGAILNQVTGLFMLGDKSELKTNYNKYLEQTGEGEEGKKQAWRLARRDMWKDVARQGAAEGWGGFLLGGSGQMVNRAYTAVMRTQAEREVNKMSKAYPGKGADIFRDNWDGDTMPEDYKASFDALWKSGQTGIGLEDTQKMASELVNRLKPSQQYGIWQASANEAASENTDPVSGRKIGTNEQIEGADTTQARQAVEAMSRDYDAPAAQRAFRENYDYTNAPEDYKAAFDTLYNAAEDAELEDVKAANAEALGVLSERQAKNIWTARQTAAQANQAQATQPENVASEATNQQAEVTPLRGAQQAEAEITAMPDVTKREESERYKPDNVHYGVVKNYTARDLNEKQKWGIMAWDRVGKEYKIEVEITDKVKNGAAFGSYAGGRRITIGLDNATDALWQVGWHENGHFIQQNDPEGYEVIKRMVLDYLAKDEDFNLENVIAERIKRYQDNGQKMDRNHAEIEIVNESLGTAMGTREFVEHFAQQDLGLLKRVQKCWHEFMEKITRIFRETTADYAVDQNSNEIAAMWQRSEEELKRLAETIDTAMRKAVENLEAAERAGQEDLEEAASVKGEESNNLKKTLPDKTSFSLKAPVEKKGELVAVHNLNEQGMSETLEIGGFPMPSVAIVKAEQGHSQYGPISVVFNASAIDPAVSEKNRIYGEDAWTPTKDNAQVESKINDDALESARARMEKVLDGLDPHFNEEAQRWISELMQNSATRENMDDWESKAWNNLGFLAAYQKSLGHDVDVKRREEVNTNGYRLEYAPIYDGFLDLLEREGKLEQFKKDAKSISGQELLDKYGELFGRSSEKAERIWSIYQEKGGGTPKRVAWNRINGAFHYLEDGRGQDLDRQMVPDWYDTKDALKDMSDRKAFRAWLDGQIGAAMGERGVRNNLDLFTSMGRRRSFEQTHWPYSAENIVRAMQSAEEKGGYARGATGLMAVSSKEYGSLDAVREDSGRLQHLDQSEYDHMISDLDRWIDDFCGKVSEYNIGQRKMITANGVEDALTEAAKAYAKKGTLKAARDAFARQGVLLNDEQATELESLINAAQEVPSGYFEAKPRRVVDFDEIAAVLAPDDLDAGLMDRMKNAGMNVMLYASGDEADRRAKLNSIDQPGVRFALKNTSKEPVATDKVLGGIGGRPAIQVLNDTTVSEKEAAEAKQREAAQRQAMTQNEVEYATALKKAADYAPRILREYQSEYNKDMLRDNLKGLMNELAQNGRSQATMDETAKLARAIIEKSKHVDNSMREQYKDLLKEIRETHVKLTETQKQEAANIAGNYNAFRMSVFGTFNLTNEGKSLDAIWDEWSTKAPELFTPGMNEGDMVQRLADIKGQMMPKVSNPYGEDMDGAATDLAMQIHEKLLGMLGDREGAKVMRDAVQDLRRQYQEAMQDELLRIRSKRRYAFDQIASSLRQANRTKNPEAAEVSMRAYRAQLQRIGAEEAEAQARIAYRIQYEDRTARAAAVKRITQNREALMKMLAKPDKKKHIPIEMQGPVLEVLNGIDITRDGKATEGSEMWKQSLKKIGDMLARQMDRQEHGGDTQGVWMTIRPEMVESFQEAADVVARSRKPMGQMTLNEIMNLSQALATVRHCINSANELFANSRYKDINDLAGQSISEMKKLKTNAAQGIEGLDTADRLLNVDSLDAGSFMERLGSAATSVFDELHEGMDRGFSVVRQASEDIPKILGLKGKNKKKREKELNAWANDKRKITLHRGAQEAEVTVTTRNLMELYAWARREQTRMHLLSGGWQPKPKKIGKLQAVSEKMQGEKLAELLNDTPVYQMSEDDLKRLVGDYEHETGTESENTGMLTLEQKKMTRAMQDYLSGPMAQLGNEVSMKMWDFMMFNEPNYWPGKTASEFRNTKEQDGTVLFNAQTNKGFTKQTQEVAKNPLVLGDAIDTFLGHIGDMANFYGYAMPVDDLLKWYNYSERDENGSLTWDGNMKKEIKRIAGQPGIEFIQHLLDDLNGGMNRGNFSSALEKIVGKAGSRYKSSSIAAKFRVAVQQPTAVARAAAFMDRRDVLAASAKMAANYATMGKFARNKIEEMQAHSPLAWWKAQGNYEIGTGASMYTILTGMHRTGREAFNERLMWLAGRMDDLGWLTIWEASEMEVKRKNKSIQVGSEEYFDKVRERFEDVCMKTQVVDTILTRTESMRNRNPLVKNLTAFQSEPLKNYNLLRNGISELRRAKQTGDQAAAKQAGKRIRRSVEAIVVSQALNAVVTALYDTIKWRDPDKDEDTFLEQFWKRFWGDYEGLTTGQAIGKALIGKGGDFLQNINPLAWITFVKDIVSVIGGDDVDRTELSAPARLVKDVQNLFGYLGDNKKGYTAWGAIKPFLKDMSQATGSPVSGLIDDTEIILNALSLATGGKVGSMKTRERAATMTGAVEELYEAVTAGDTARAARLRANMEKGQFGQDPMSPKDIDTKLAKMLAREDERVAQAWEAAQDIDGGSTKTRLRNDLMKDGWSKETADYAIDHYDEIMTGDAKAALKQAKADGDEDAAEGWRDVLRSFGWDEEKIAGAEAEKDLEEELESPKATVKELYQMIRAGETAEASAIRGRLIADGKSKEDVSKGLADMLATYDQRIETLWNKRNTGHALKPADYQAVQKDGFTDEEVKRAVNQYPNIVKSEVKKLYLQAMADGDAKAAAGYRQRLLDVGTKEETIDGWAVGKDLDAELEEQKMYTNANLWASIRGDDTTDADILDIRDYMLSQSKAADPEASLRSSMTSEFKLEYVDLMVSGRTREAERLKKRLVLAGAKEETINGWVQSAKKDEYIDLVNAGKTQEAEKLRSAMISAGGKADTIDNWVPAAQKKEATDALKTAIEKRDSRAAEAEIERILDEELMDKSAIVSSLNSKFKQKYFDLMDAGREREADELADMLAGLGLRKKNGDNYYAGSWWNEQYRDYLKKQEEDE